MTPKQHIIELNGKKYDALTGKIVPILVTNATRPVKTTAKRSNLDGFSRVTKAPQTKRVDNSNNKKIEKSSTLMRTSVKKPSPNKLPSSIASAKSSPSIMTTHSSLTAYTIAKAKSIQKSALIRKFNDMAPAIKPSTHNKSSSIASSDIHKVKSTSTVIINPIEAKLASANSHKQPKPKLPRAYTRAANKLNISKKVLSAGSFILAMLLIGAFFAFQNMSNISMKIASSRAGVKGAIPNYQPSGFGLRGGISYKPGQIIIGYKSNSDNRNFVITQSSSNWNSETLLNNYDPLKQNSSFQTIPVKGKTVYLYDGSNATWVDGGIWYRIEGDSKLNSDQLISLANSM